MLTRLTHAGVAFAVVAAAYQGYVLAVAPLVEPRGAAVHEAQALSPDALATPPASLERYRPVLAAYFPQDHWCFRRPPTIIENSQAMIVVDEYTQSEGGELRVPRCALVFFPTPRDGNVDPPRDAIILEPSGGATLQMDQKLGRGLGSPGRMQYGQLLGDVRVRSDMRESGPQDDLLVETRDLYMNEDLIRTTEAVTMRMGQHYGRGRGLEIHFFKAESTSGDPAATLFGKLESLEISHEVAALVAPGATTLFGERAPVESERPRNSGAAMPPAEIKCTGPFRIDFGNRVATFTDRVRLWQRHPDGALDELTAKELTLYFAETREWGGDAAPSGGPLGSFRFEPATVEAVGAFDEPVLLKAPSQGAVATGQRLRIELITRQATLEGGDEVSVFYRGAEIHAPMVRYELPPRGSTERLGLMAARGGGGRLRAVPDPKRPIEVLEVRWTQSMQLVRRGGQPVLVLDGRPRVEMLGLGTLWADALELHLREHAATAQPAGADAGPLPTTIEAERIVAAGNVGIESAELTGKVGRLDLRIASSPTGSEAAGESAGASDNATGASGAATTPLWDRRRGGARRAYNIRGAELAIDAVVRDRRPQVTGIRVDGGVEFGESTAGAGGEAPLRILAEHLVINDAHTPDAKIEIAGGDATETRPAGLAEIAARGTVLRAPKLNVRRGAGQAWINSPGEVRMLVNRDATGRPLSRPQPLAITWRDSMHLDKNRITLEGNVHVQHPEGWLRTQRLAALLTAPVQFDGSAGGAPPELARLECWEGAEAEFDQRDAAGNVTSHQRIEVRSLAVNHVTGEIRGDGPGRVDSIHLSKGDGAWLVMPDAAGSSPEQSTPVQQPVPDGPPQLRHLSVEFARGVDGNIHAPAVRVYGDVRTIYGPVGSWDERLTMTASGRPGPDTFWITCDSLQVADSPLARIQRPAADGRRRAFGQVELTCETNVVIEGEHPEHGAFTLRGHRATYDQAKTMFVLQGDGRTPATVNYQQFPGAPLEEQSAQKIFYWQNTGVLRVEGVNKIQLQDFNAR